MAVGVMHVRHVRMRMAEFVMVVKMRMRLSRRIEFAVGVLVMDVMRMRMAVRQ